MLEICNFFQIFYLKNLLTQVVYKEKCLCITFQSHLRVFTLFPYLHV